jgi:hypothetical protein
MIQKWWKIIKAVVNEHKFYGLIICIALFLYLFSNKIAIVIEALKILVKEEFK